MRTVGRFVWPPSRRVNDDTGARQDHQILNGTSKGAGEATKEEKEEFLRPISTTEAPRIESIVKTAPGPSDCSSLRPNDCSDKACGYSWSGNETLPA
jgi:hypothetical protein